MGNQPNVLKNEDKLKQYKTKTPKNEKIDQEIIDQIFMEEGSDGTLKLKSASNKQMSALRMSVEPYPEEFNKIHYDQQYQSIQPMVLTEDE